MRVDNLSISQCTVCTDFSPRSLPKEASLCAWNLAMRWMANHLRCSVSCTSILLDLLGLWPSSILSSSILLSNIWTCLMSKMQSSSLPFRCNTCKKRMPIFAQFIGAQGKHTCFTEALGSVENNLQYLYVDYE